MDNAAFITEQTINQIAQRDKGSPDPDAMENRRYVEGQKIYLLDCDPKSRASVVVNNEDLSALYIVEGQELST